MAAAAPSGIYDGGDVSGSSGDGGGNGAGSLGDGGGIGDVPQVVALVVGGNGGGSFDDGVGKWDGQFR